MIGDQAQLENLRAQLAQQRAQLDLDRLRDQRASRLLSSQAGSQDAADAAAATVRIGEAKIQALEAQIKQTQATLDGDLANLGYTKIYAPMDGVVVSTSATEGQTLNANQTAPIVLRIADLDTMQVWAQVAEADVSKLTPNMEMYFTTLGSQGRKWKGNVRQILPSPQTVNDVVLYDVLSDVDNKDGALMTGMTTQMFFVLGRAKDVLVIPSSVLMKRVPESDTQTAKAYEVRVAGGKDPVTKIVLIGLSDRTSAQIISGLSQGERVMLPASTAPATSQQPGAARARSMGPRL